jgi:hypothetical protein
VNARNFITLSSVQSFTESAPDPFHIDKVLK